MSNTTMTQADFERLLEVYGADRSRWPAEARAAAGQLVAHDARARGLLAEAVALDRVLERAPLPTLAREAALAERIVSAAQRSPRIVRIGGMARKPPQGPEHSAVVALNKHRDRSSGPAWSIMREGLNLRAAALLAASLVAGFFIGFANTSQQVLPAFEAVTGINLPTVGNYNLAQIDPFDEDQL
jgi:hypothetical protein